MRMILGSMQNVLMDNAKHAAIEIGAGATMLGYTDRYPATVIAVATTKTGRAVVTVQEDHATRVDRNGMSDSQHYVYSRNPQGNVYKFRQDKQGRFKEVPGSGRTLVVGTRQRYYDYSF